MDKKFQRYYSSKYQQKDNRIKVISKECLTAKKKNQKTKYFSRVTFTRNYYKTFKVYTPRL